MGLACATTTTLTTTTLLYQIETRRCVIDRSSSESLIWRGVGFYRSLVFQTEAFVSVSLFMCAFSIGWTVLMYGMMVVAQE